MARAMRIYHRFARPLSQLGPGLTAGAADDDPSGIATYSQAGASYGFGLLWTMLLTYPLMVAVQMVSAQIARVTGKGLAANMAVLWPRWLVTVLVMLLLVANTINIGADLSAMGDAAELAIGVNSHGAMLVFTVVTLSAQLFLPYARYARVLRWLTLVLFAYIAVLLAVKVDWPAALRGMVVPQLADAKAVTMIVALFGTTISPYLFFWQSAQVVEELDADHAAAALVDAPQQAREAFARIRVDTIVGMAFSNLIALAIIIATAATLHRSTGHPIETAAQAAQALRPIAGDFAFALFSLGIIGTGLLAVPVLSGSAAYAIADARGWKSGLDEQPAQAKGFYGVIALATLVGVALQWTDTDPIKALFWSAVINGVVAVPMMAAMMLVATNHRAMRRYTASRSVRWLGWTATGVMATAAIAMVFV
jgi:NRAMP (natural resistance-associated macrophage protein)-like metal ion transporter